MPGITSEYGLSIIEWPVLQVNMGICNTGHSMMDNPELLVIPGIL
jgi:hypothetical protein